MSRPRPEVLGSRGYILHSVGPQIGSDFLLYHTVYFFNPCSRVLLAGDKWLSANWERRGNKGTKEEKHEAIVNPRKASKIKTSKIEEKQEQVRCGNLLWTDLWTILSDEEEEKTQATKVIRRKSGNMPKRVTDSDARGGVHPKRRPAGDFLLIRF